MWPDGRVGLGLGLDLLRRDFSRPGPVREMPMENSVNLVFFVKYGLIILKSAHEVGVNPVFFVKYDPIILKSAPEVGANKERAALEPTSLGNILVPK